MLGESSGEDDEWCVLDSTEDLSAEQTRHLHVADDELWAQCVDLSPCRFAVARLSDDLDPINRAEHGAQAGARDWRVVHEERGDLHDCRALAWGTTSTAS